jgi:SOS-response transcriptional repressor LexA
MTLLVQDPSNHREKGMATAEELGTRVKRMLKEKGMSQAQLARLVGTKQQTISYICSEDHPATTSRYSSKIAEILGVNPTWLATGQGNPYDQTVPIHVEGVSVRATQIPLLTASEVPAFLSGQHEQRGGAVVTDRVHSPTAFALAIEGESMSPRFKDGDTVVIDPMILVEPGDFVAAMLKTGLITFRRYRARHPGYELVPENSDWDNIHSHDVNQIVGVMVEHRTYRKLKD